MYRIAVALAVTLTLAATVIAVAPTSGDGGFTTVDAAHSIPDGGGNYTVRAGDTLSHIALSHDTTIVALANMNGISNPNRIFAGQHLSVPHTVVGGTHIVSAGETMSGIAVDYGTTVGAIMEANNISNPHRIFVGQRLTIPGAQTSSYNNLPGVIVRNSERAALIPVFEQWAAHYGLPVDLFMAVCFQESGWQQDVKQPVNPGTGRPRSSAIGVCQILLGTAEFINTALISPDDTRHNAEGNIRMAAAYLHYLRGFFDGDIRLAIAGFKQGHGSIQRNGINSITRQYLDSVYSLRTRFQ